MSMCEEGLGAVVEGHKWADCWDEDKDADEDDNEDDEDEDDEDDDEDDEDNDNDDDTCDGEADEEAEDDGETICDRAGNNTCTSFDKHINKPKSVREEDALAVRLCVIETNKSLATVFCSTVCL